MNIIPNTTEIDAVVISIIVQENDETVLEEKIEPIIGWIINCDEETDDVPVPVIPSESIFPQNRSSNVFIGVRLEDGTIVGPAGEYWKNYSDFYNYVRSRAK